MGIFFKTAVIVVNICNEHKKFSIVQLRLYLNNTNPWIKGKRSKMIKIVSLCAIEPAPIDYTWSTIAKAVHTYDYLTRVAVSYEMSRWWWRAILMSTNRVHLYPARFIFRPFSDLWFIAYIEENKIASTDINSANALVSINIMSIEKM